MRKLGYPCETCYSGRPARFILMYDKLPMCWVCKLIEIGPNWLYRIIRKYDRAGFTRHDD